MIRLKSDWFLYFWLDVRVFFIIYLFYIFANPIEVSVKGVVCNWIRDGDEKKIFWVLLIFWFFCCCCFDWYFSRFIRKIFFSLLYLKIWCLFINMYLFIIFKKNLPFQKNLPYQTFFKFILCVFLLDFETKIKISIFSFIIIIFCCPS